MNKIKLFEEFEERYLSDEEIEDSYRDWKINEKEFKWRSEKKESGYILLERPDCNHNDKDCYDEYPIEQVDSFIIYDNGKIAFDYWYPDFLYLKMCDFIYNHLPKNHRLKNKVKNFLNSINSEKTYENLNNDISTKLNRDMKKIWNFDKYTNHQSIRGIIQPGKFLDLGDVKGYINKIEGKYVYLETIDGSNDLKKVSFAKIAKHYKISDEKIEIYQKPELKIGKSIKMNIDNKSKKDKDSEKLSKEIYHEKNIKLKNKLGGPKTK